MNVRARILTTLALAATVAPLSTLCAQSAAPAPKVELFLGYSRFAAATNPSTGTAGNRMVDLNGGSAALTFNLNRYLGLVADVSAYRNTQLQLTGTGANQPRTVPANGNAFTYLFGPRLSFRNDTRFTPFVHVLAGGVHASAVTATNCVGPTCTPLPAQNAFAMTAGGGLDIRLFQHLSLRPIQAEYMMTRFASILDGTKTTQNDLRLASGLVFTFGGRHLTEPLQLACTTQPQSVFPGDPVLINATPTYLNPKHPAIYHWTSTAGTISGTEASAQIDTHAVAPGTYTVSGNVSQGSRPAQQATCSTSFTVRAFDPPTIACSAIPSTLLPGDSAAITAQATSPQHRPLTYTYTSSAGNITGNDTTAVLSTAGVTPGPITVTCAVADDLGKSASATTTLNLTAPSQPTVSAAAPETRTLCALSFERDRKRPVRVDNEAKACLDDIALTLQRDSAGRLVILGTYAADEKSATGAARATNARKYLLEEKGIDPQRIDLRVLGGTTRTAIDTFIPSGATYPADDSIIIEPTSPSHAR
jgi:opacity protein-like surface antigen